MGLFNIFRRTPLTKPTVEGTRYQTESDVRASRAHMLLKTYFLVPVARDRTWSPAWADVLKEPVSTVVSRLMENGELVECSLAEVLRTLRVVDQKALLKARGQVQAGTQDERVARLLKLDPSELLAEVKPERYLILSAAYADGIRAFSESEKASELAMVASTLECVRTRRFTDAALTVSRFERAAVFPRGVGYGWSDEAAKREAEFVARLFLARPAILGTLSNETWEMLAQVAAMSHLLGRQYVPPEGPSADATFGNHQQLKVDAAARMIEFYVRTQDDLLSFRSIDVAYVEILTCGSESCEECQSLPKGRVAIGSVPELPHRRCSSVKGCRCYLSPILHE